MAAQAAWGLNCQPHDAPIPVAARRLKPPGNPPPNGIRFFAASELPEPVKDRAGLVKVTNAVNQHLHKQNARKKNRPAHGLQNGPVSPAGLVVATVGWLKLGHGADAPEIGGGWIGRVGEHQHPARVGGIGQLRHPVGRCQAEGTIQRVIRYGDAHKGQLHVARPQKLAGDLIVARGTLDRPQSVREGWCCSCRYQWCRRPTGHSCCRPWPTGCRRF